MCRNFEGFVGKLVWFLDSTLRRDWRLGTRLLLSHPFAVCGIGYPVAVSPLSAGAQYKGWCIANCELVRKTKRLRMDTKLSAAFALLLLLSATIEVSSKLEGIKIAIDHDPCMLNHTRRLLQEKSRKYNLSSYVCMHAYSTSIVLAI